MPTGMYFASDLRRPTPPKVGHPARNRSKNKAQRQARKQRR